MLVEQGEQLAFRHELARQAVLEAIPPPRRVAIHRLALAALAALPGGGRDPARLAHHAAGAGDEVATLAHAPVAARQAAATGAHRAAAALFALALPHAGGLPLADRAALHEAHAEECLQIAETTDAIASRIQAVDLWRAAGDPLKQGESLGGLARAFFVAGRRAEAHQTSQAAIELLEAQPHGRELAQAYSALAMLRLLDHDLADAIALAERVIALAEPVGDASLLSGAYNVLGSAYMLIDNERGRRYLEHARAIAQKVGLDAAVARAYANLGSGAVRIFQLDQAEHDLAAGLAYCSARDLDRLSRHMIAWLAVVHLYRGRWTEAAAAATEILDARAVSSNARWAALLALGRLQARRDGVAAPPPLDEALALGQAWGEFQMIGPVRAARAEAAYLAGDRARTLAETRAAWDLALAKQHPWIAGELAFWRWRAGEAVSLPDWMAEPFAQQIAGDWRTAAQAWDRLGCPYEQAHSLADGDASARATALDIFQALGARPAAAALRRIMRAAGASRIPRGPWRATRESRYGLTARQGEILDLLTEGLSNAAIATRLSISPKTVDHHVSAILAQLHVHSREAAADWARQHQPPR
jgi:DNA-binding CsgD family transcriptional regulator